jgi:hypothetical protein
MLLSIEALSGYIPPPGKAIIADRRIGIGQLGSGAQWRLSRSRLPRSDARSQTLVAGLAREATRNRPQAAIETLVGVFL